jgi:superoxide dismutase, Fe-Mn family
MIRREFLYLLGGTTGAIAADWLAPTQLWAAETPKPAAQGAPKPATPHAFSLPPLAYAYNALEPHIDERTMKIHHDLHHGAYVKNLNAAVEKYPQLRGKPVETLIGDLNAIPADVRTVVRNNGGGHANHAMFWDIMGPNAGGEPTGALADALKASFGSFADFKKQFNEAGMKRFGSGWVWLIRHKSGKLEITSTANQDSPIMENDFPIMGNDLWEHAYYLLYQNKRADYLNAWWNVVNWQAVSKRYTMAMRSK